MVIHWRSLSLCSLRGLFRGKQFNFWCRRSVLVWQSFGSSRERSTAAPNNGFM